VTPDPHHVRVELDLPAVAQSAARARRAVVEAISGYPVDRDAIALIVSEAVTNAILHAYRELAEPGRVRVTAGLGPDGLDLEVVDTGLGPQPRDDSPGAGLGLQLIAKLADDVAVSDDEGTRLRARISGSGDADASAP